MNELSIYHWTQYISTNKPELETSAEFAERILMVISKQYPHLSTKSHDVVSLLKPKKCISTRFGMKLPGDAYFPSVNLFDDLPVIKFTQAKALNDAFLTALGIRKVSLVYHLYLL